MFDKILDHFLHVKSDQKKLIKNKSKKSCDNAPLKGKSFTEAKIKILQAALFISPNKNGLKDECVAFPVL
jgi:hypothetical protein